MTNNAKIVDIMESLWPKNKAKGILAQARLFDEALKGNFGSEAKDKLLSGAWLFSPRGSDAYKFRFSFFVHPTVFNIQTVGNDLRTILGEKFRSLLAVAEFLANAGVGVIYAIPCTQTGYLPYKELRDKSFENIHWKGFIYENGSFVSKELNTFFGLWGGGKGRLTVPTNPMEFSTKKCFLKLDESSLVGLLLNELFFSGYIKGVLRKSVSDPYDIDSFVISLSQRYIFPVEIKEKFPAESNHQKFFGIDAGRIIMLLRLCMPNDANAIYLVRELSEEGDFIGWKYITLSEIIMYAGWNLQAGGLGMGGSSTQTVILPYEMFKTWDSSQLEEGNLQKLGRLPTDTKNIAQGLMSKFQGSYYSKI